MCGEGQVPSSDGLGCEDERSFSSPFHSHGVSPGGKAALVIFLVIVPLCVAGAVIGWVAYRKKTGKPIMPEKLSELIAKVTTHK